MGSICTAEAPAFSVIIAPDFGVADVNLESKPDHELFAEGDASGSKAVVPKTRRAPSLQNFCVGDAAGDGLSTEERASVARTPPAVKWGGEVEERCEQVLLGMLRSANTTPVSTYLTLVPTLHPALSKPLRLAERLSVAVIGGGVAGLLTAKWMQEEGHRVVIFEAEDHLGGIWSKGSSRLYPTLHSNTPRSWMHFSDFEFPAPDTGSLEFPHHSMVTAQVHAYVEKFGLAKLAQLNSRVDKVSRAGDTWRVTVNGIDQHFDRVCLCNGKLQEPAVPTLPGPGGAGSSSPRIFSDWQSSGSPVACLECETQQKRGSTLFFHSCRLGTLGTGVFAGRHVVVVGFGQASGADVCELAVAKGAASVTVVVQKPIFLLPRMLDQKPIEEQMTVLSVLQPQLLPLLAQLPGLHAPVEVAALHRTATVYVCGGSTGLQALRSVERFCPLTGMWEALPPLAQGRTGAAGGTLRGCLYVCGGCTGRQILRDTERYNPMLGKWEQLQGLLERRRAALGVVLGGQLYVAGGEGGADGEYVLSSVERYDADLECWEAVPALETHRFGMAGAAVRGCLFACGGSVGMDALACAEVLNPGRGGWEALPPMLEGRVGAAAMPLGSRLFIAGGGQVDRVLLTTEFLCLESGHWQPGPALKEGFRSAASAAVAGHLLVFGGQASYGHSHRSVRSVDPECGTCEALPPMAAPRTGAVAIRVL